MKKRALLSVSDKSGLVDLAKNLVELGYEIISTGGTSKALQASGIEVMAVSEVTGFPEILEGRVKTLHPKVHGGILAKRTPAHLEELNINSITPIDIVVVNLYPFKETIAKPNVTIEDAIENIDIGGPTMVRAAAKNHEAVAIVVNPKRYEDLIQELKTKGSLSLEFKRLLAYEAFTHTAQYDAMISSYFAGLAENEGFGATYSLLGEKVQDLRYGENPHQKAAFYKTGEEGLANAQKIQGKELSYNNLMDLEAALQVVQEFAEPACAIIKHTNPCGVAIGDNIKEAYLKAYGADSISAFGGIVALNKEVDGATAEEMVKLFLEAIIAPGFSEAALEILANKPNLRVLILQDIANNSELEIKKISGGFLLQEQDKKEEALSLTWVTAKQAAELQADLELAWKIVKHVKSNAIVTVKNGVTTGIGPGQTNRVGAAKIALEQAKEKAKDGVLASDAFFPFRDTVDLAATYGIKAIVQPGGSNRDEESIAACNEQGLAMAFTGRRHFKH